MPAGEKGARRLQRLATPHKWQLGGGRRVIWAPDFPLFLNVPGFWDPGTYLEIRLGSLFTYALLEHGRPLALLARGRRWWPDRLVTRFGGPGLRMAECKSVTVGDEFRSEIALTNTTGRTRVLDVILWGRIDATDMGDTRFGPVAADRRRITGRYAVRDPHKRSEHDLQMTWTFSSAQSGGGPCTSFAVQNSERSGEQPDWRVSPFHELFGRRLPGSCHWRGGIEHRPGARPQRKWVFVALHRRVRIGPRRTVELVGACRVEPRRGKPRRGPTVPGWPEFFEQAPVFRCSDAYLERYFDYRWYGLRLNAVDHAGAGLAHPCVFEGVNAGWFRHAISYSAQVLAKECRWLRDPALARGCLLNFIEAQTNSGFIPGALLAKEAELDWHGGLMYHADWGGAVQDVYAVHPDREFLQRCYAGLARYGEWLDRERDAQQTGLYDVVNQAETGQEYTSRYLFVEPRADEWGKISLKGVDATVYAYKLQRALAWMAGVLERPDEVRAWQRRAEATRSAVRSKMWDHQWQKFCDVDPRSGHRSPVKVLTDFYPFLTDIATRDHLPAIRAHLLNPRAFWTEWPAPSTALDERLADAYGRWLGKRHICPWNGRTWLMTNSHIADALARVALMLDSRLEPYAVVFITRFIHMLFLERDLGRPSSFEYYNPLTGQPPFFRGVDDYMHSYVVDLIMRYVVGLRPQVDGSIVVQPLQFGLKRFSLDNCVVGGRPVKVNWDGKRLAASVGRARESARGLGRLVLEPE